MTRIRYTQSPDSTNPHLIEDLLEMVRTGKQGCADGVIKMIADLYEQGSDCRYLKGLGGGLLELKTRTPVGGARVYLFQGLEGEFVLCRAECKRESVASMVLLEHTAKSFLAYRAQQAEAKKKVSDGKKERKS